MMYYDVDVFVAISGRIVYVDWCDIVLCVIVHIIFNSVCVEYSVYSHIPVSVLHEYMMFYDVDVLVVISGRIVHVDWCHYRIMC